jgi:hypothetical protein
MTQDFHHHYRSAISPDGAIVAFSHSDWPTAYCGISFLSAQNVSDRWRVPATADDLEFHPDGTLIVACSHLIGLGAWYKGTIWTRNLATGQTRWVRAFDGRISTVIVSPDGRFLAAAVGSGRESRVRLWRWEHFAP